MIASTTETPNDLTTRQRRQLGAALDNLTDAASHLSALIESEPDGVRDLIIVRHYTDMLAAILLRRYGEAPPPAPATATAQASSASATDGQAA